MSFATDFLQNLGQPTIGVPVDVLDIGRRIKEGDEYWRGDPNMELCWNMHNDLFEVIAIDAKGQPYVATQAEVCDVRILMQLAESDWQHGSKAMIDKLAKDELKKKGERETEMLDIQGALADKLAWAVHRAFAAHLGGKSNSYSMNSGRRD